MGSHGKVNRPRILKAIEYGVLDGWISAKDVALAINNEYQVVQDPSHDNRTGKVYYRKRVRRNIWMTTMSAAVILNEFCRKGLVEVKRKNRGDVGLYRKVDKTEGHVDTEAKE